MRPFIVFIVLFCYHLCSAQSPWLMPYQAVARAISGAPLVNTTLTARFSIHDASSDGEVVWQEQHVVTTNATGLFTVELGSVSSLESVQWKLGDKFMQVELNTGNGFVDIGTQQMVSAPYALHTNGVGYDVSPTGDTLFIGHNDYVIVPGISAANPSGGGNSDGGGGSAGTFTGTTNHTCGLANVVNTDLTYNSVIDQEGNIYKTIVIGSQEWMAENLSTSTYRNGDPIVSGLDATQWSGTTLGAWTFYNGGESFECPYGKLYNFYACTDARQLCPTGWHVPTDAEWSTLINFFDPNAQGGNVTNTAGGPLKSTGILQSFTGIWNSPNTGATNTSGFSALPGGFITIMGVANNIGNNGYYWTSSEVDANVGIGRILYNNSSNVFRSINFGKRSGFSVRCLKDQ